jgi:hypothetical protein
MHNHLIVLKPFVSERGVFLVLGDVMSYASEGLASNSIIVLGLN